MFLRTDSVFFSFERIKPADLCKGERSVFFAARIELLKARFQILGIPASKGLHGHQFYLFCLTIRKICGFMWGFKLLSQREVHMKIET
jgi:hypothetical protein